MTRQTATQTQQQTPTTSLLSRGSILQRKCESCGQHTIAGGECAECAKNKSGLQRKLTIGASNDPLEREADRVADEVLAAPLNSTVSGAPPHIQRYAGQATEGMDTAPASVDRVLASSSGKPLESSLRQDMEQRFGHDFSRVRVHSGVVAEQSARDVNAHAYTVGHNIVFGAGQFAPGMQEGQRLLAHELTHVVQQTGGIQPRVIQSKTDNDQPAMPMDNELPHVIQQVGEGGSGADPLQISPSDEHIARQPNPSQMSPRNAGKRVLDVHTSDRPRRTRVTVAITGHASPRWSSARSDLQADKLNLELSHKREKAVRDRVEQLLREALPDQQLVFEYAQQSSIDIDPFDIDPFNIRATVNVESSAAGSKQTLQEAGKAGRRANAPSMLRVDLSVSLSSAIDTIQDTKTQEKRQVSGATQKWAIKMGVAMQVEEGVGGGGFNFMLKNGKTGQEVEGWAEFSTAGVGVSVPVPTIDMGGYEDFSTKQPANFSDFDFKRFTIASAGFNALLGGYEWSSMSIWGLPGGNVDDIDVGGFVMGGAGIDLSSAKFGMIWLRETPDTYPADIVSDERKFYTSRMTEEKRHHVFFETGEAKISADQEKALRNLINSEVENYQRGGVYSQP